MIKVSILYARTETSTFNLDYYVNSHVPLCAKRFGPALRKMELDEGVSGAPPGTPAPFMAGVHFYFDSEAAFYDAFGPYAEELRNDVANYTNVTPLVQFSRVR